MLERRILFGFCWSIFLRTAIGQDLNGVPLVAACSFMYDGYSLHWSVDTAGSVNFNLTLRNAPPGNFWTGVGFGEAALSGLDVIVVESINGQVQVSEASSRNGNVSPNGVPAGGGIRSLGGTLSNGVLQALFSRPLQGGGPPESASIDGCIKWNFFVSPCQIDLLGNLQPPNQQPLTQRFCDIRQHCPTPGSLGSAAGYGMQIPPQQDQPNSQCNPCAQAATGQNYQQTQYYGNPGNGYGNPNTIGQPSYGNPNTIGQSNYENTGNGYGNPNTIGQPSYGNPSTIGQSNYGNPGNGYGNPNTIGQPSYGNPGYGYNTKSTGIPTMSAGYNSGTMSIQTSNGPNPNGNGSTMGNPNGYYTTPSPYAIFNGTTIPVNQFKRLQKQKPLDKRRRRQKRQCNSCQPGLTVQPQQGFYDQRGGNNGYSTPLPYSYNPTTSPYTYPSSTFATTGYPIVSNAQQNVINYADIQQRYGNGNGLGYPLQYYTPGPALQGQGQVYPNQNQQPNQQYLQYQPGQGGQQPAGVDFYWPYLTTFGGGSNYGNGAVANFYTQNGAFPIIPPGGATGYYNPPGSQNYAAQQGGYGQGTIGNNGYSTPYPNGANGFAYGNGNYPNGYNQGTIGTTPYSNNGHGNQLYQDQGTIGTGYYNPGTNGNSGYSTPYPNYGNSYSGSNQYDPVQAQQAAVQQQQQQNAIALQNFQDPSCTQPDPYFCQDYVRQFLDWQQKFSGNNLQAACGPLVDSLRNANNGCCQSVRQAGCNNNIGGGGGGNYYQG